MLGRSAGKFLGLGVRAPDLDAEAVGALQVVPEELVVLEQRCRVVGEPVGVPLMELGPRCFWHRLVCRIPDELVVEAVGLAGRELRLVRAKDLLADERLELLLDRCGAVAESDYRGGVEDLALDRAALE